MKPPQIPSVSRLRHSCVTKPNPLSTSVWTCRADSRTPSRRASRGGIIVLRNWAAERTQQERLESLRRICLCLSRVCVCVFIETTGFPGFFSRTADLRTVAGSVQRTTQQTQGETRSKPAPRNGTCARAFLRVCCEDDQPTDGPLMSFKVRDRGGFLSLHQLIPTSASRLLHEVQQQRSRQHKTRVTGTPDGPRALRDRWLPEPWLTLAAASNPKWQRWCAPG